MPFAKIKAAFIGTGVSIHYELSSPLSPTAKAIDPNLPTIIFLHGVYIASVRSPRYLFVFQVLDPESQPIFESELRILLGCLASTHHSLPQPNLRTGS